MLVFVDESGDTGLALHKGASRYFVVIMVVFASVDDAAQTDQRISQLRQELNLPERFEFHFHGNSDRQRAAFLNAVAAEKFRCYAVVTDKARLLGDSRWDRTSIYKTVCNFVLESMRGVLSDAHIRIDRGGGATFNHELSSYLKKQINRSDETRRHIRDVSHKDSANDNLIQLADMVVGAVARSLRSGNLEDARFLEIVKHRIASVLIWPPA